MKFLNSRSFSLLGRLFTDIRASMGDERLSELALCAYFKDECQSIDLDEIVTEYDEMQGGQEGEKGEKKKRRFHNY